MAVVKTYYQERRRISATWNCAGIYIAFVLFSVVVLLPIYWMLRSAFAVQADLTLTPLVYFPNPTLHNFEMPVDQIPFVEYTRNAIVFSIGTTMTTLIVSYLAAYAFARLRVRGSGILLPLTAPGLVTMGVINFINAWNNLLYPLSFSVTPAPKTLSVSITEVFTGFSPWGRPWELIMAVGVSLVIPITLLILVSQKAIVRGLTGSAVK